MLKIFRKNKAEKLSSGECRINKKINRRSIIIHHYCPHTYNAGDHFVIHAIRNSLKERIPEAVFVPKPCAVNRGWGKPFRLAGKNITFSSRYADAVVVGGSDQYNGWSLRIKKDEITLLEPPYYLIGLGISSKGLHEEPHIQKEEYLEDIKAANRHAAMSSVRDSRTDDFLKKLGVDKHVLTGCPATFLFNRPFKLNTHGPVLLTFPFPVVRSSNAVLYENINELMKNLLQYFKKNGIETVIVCHDDRDLPAAQEIFPEERLFFSNYATDYYPLYENASIIIGTRLHATILAAGMGKPFININLDSRGLGFSETFGLAKWNINMEGGGVFDKIIERAEQIFANDLSVFSGFYKTKEKYRKIYNEFMDQCAEDILSRLKNR